MSKMVGLSRPIKIEWLNKTVELIKEGKNETEIKNELNHYLSFEFSSPTNLRKTREILLATWVRTPEEYDKVKNMALEIYDGENVDKLVIHWCMMLLTYPVFSDVCALIGKLTNVQETFTTAWLKQKLFDLWGERTTLLHSIDKILQTLKYLGAIRSVKNGEFESMAININNEKEIGLIVLTVLMLKNESYFEVNELSQVPQMFPFKYRVTKEFLHQSDIFTLSTFGGKVMVTGAEKYK